MHDEYRDLLFLVIAIFTVIIVAVIVVNIEKIRVKNKPPVIQTYVNFREKEHD